LPPPRAGRGQPAAPAADFGDASRAPGPEPVPDQNWVLTVTPEKSVTAYRLT
jgi:hypothetical protein